MPPSDSRDASHEAVPVKSDGHATGVDLFRDIQRDFDELEAQANRNTVIILAAIYNRWPPPIERSS